MSEYLVILVVTFDANMIIEKHLRSVSRSVSLKLDWYHKKNRTSISRSIGPSEIF